MWPASRSSTSTNALSALTLLLVLLAAAGKACAQSCAADLLLGVPQLHNVFGQQRKVNVADLNGDQIPDLVLSSRELAVSLGSMSGGLLTFGTPREYPVNLDPTGSAIADFDADGILDIIVACDGGGLYQFHGLGDGTFVSTGIYNIGSCWDVIAADVNADAVLDLVISARNGSLLVMRGTGADGQADGGFMFPAEFRSIGSPKGLLVMDLNGDGALDAVAATETKALAVHLGELRQTGPTGRFGPPITVQLPDGSTYDVTAADFNGDGRLDLASADDHHSITVCLQLAPLAFSGVVQHSVAGASLGIRAADFNHDGYPDLVASLALGSASVALMLNEGPNSAAWDHLGRASSFGPARIGYGITLADLNGDRLPDVLVPSVSNDDLAIFLDRCPLDGITLAITVTGNGTVTRAPDRPAYAAGDTVTLTATPSPTYTFAGWSGDATGSASPLTVVMDRSRFITAAFPPVTHNLRTRVVGLGRVRRTPDTGVFHEGTTVGLKALPGLGYLFSSWSGDVTSSSDSLELVMSVDHSVTASFIPDPAVTPRIESVTDVPLDQGGLVKLRWRSSVFEFVPQDSGIAVTHYFVWREIPQAALAAIATTPPPGPERRRQSIVAGRVYSWEFLGSLPAGGFDSYSYVAATGSDSLARGNPYTSFMIQARDLSGTRYWDSPPDSGYSVDNLGPSAPAQFSAALEGGIATLRWSALHDPDLLEYRVHGGADAAFVPADVNLLGSTRDTVFLAAGPARAFYKLVAMDVHGNAGDALLTALLGQAFALEGALPNPSVGRRCMVHFVLPSAAPARLTLLDVTGRVVVEQEIRQAGRRSVDLAANRRIRAGLYWLRLSQGPDVRTQRVVVLE